jgi:ParB-like chromosome segregation protein Spo0J
VTSTHQLAVEYVPIDGLRTFHANPRRGDVGAIKTSLRVNGQYRPLVANRGTHTSRPAEVLAGNHTLIAACALGWDTIAVCWVDVDDEAAARIVAADNRTADRGDYDDELLAELLGGLPDLDGTGYDQADLDALLALLDPDENDDEESDAAAWPTIKCQVRPEVYDAWMNVPGHDDAERVVRVLAAFNNAA